MRIAVCLVLCTFFLFFNTVMAQQIAENRTFDEPLSEFALEAEVPASFFTTSILEPTRFTLRHELSYKLKNPDGIKNHRTSFRLEYKKAFLKYFFLQFDSKLNTFWSNDHRAKAKGENIYFENNFIEGFLQFSIKQTSIKAGIQKVIWGESEAGAITDVISPRDYSELFFISLEESRRGQPMISVDQFTKIGDWVVFFVPFPVLNRYPLKGTAYYADPFGGKAGYRDEKSDKENFEYGLRWKKTFGSSDISIMAASLVDNDYANRLDGSTPDGELIVTKMKKRVNMAGLTFNYALGDFILKGEAALKLQKAYNNASFQVVEKNAADASLGLDYTPGAGSLSLSLEAVNSRVIGWNDAIQFVPRNINSLVFTCYKTYFSQTLSFLWLTIYNSPYTSFLHRLTISYKLNDNFTLFLNGFYPHVRDEKSPNWMYRDQKQLDFKIQYQF
jgi:hypothetical protein